MCGGEEGRGYRKAVGMCLECDGVRRRRDDISGFVCARIGRFWAPPTHSAANSATVMEERVKKTARRLKGRKDLCA